MLPSGCARLAMSPSSSALPPEIMTIGMVLVASLAARTALAPPPTTSISTLRRTSSAASSGSRSTFPSAKRYSRAILWPSTYPRSRSPWRKASKLRVRSGSDMGSSTPMRGTFVGCCASVASDATRMARASMSPMALRRMVESSSMPTRAYSQGVSRGAHPLGHPGEIGLVALEETADGVHQHGVGSSGVETAGLLERQDALHPAVAFVTGRPQGPLPPQDATPQGSLGPVVGRLDAVVGEKDPQRVHLPQQAAGKPSRVIGAIMILRNQATQPSVPGPPFSPRRWGRGHMAHTL